MTIKLDMTRFQPIYGESAGTNFLALFSKAAFDLIEFAGSGGYNEVRCLSVDADEVPNVIRSLEGPYHIFCVTTDAPFRSPSPEILKNVKLGVMPLYSTGFSASKLEIALELLFQIDYAGQYQQSRYLLNHLAGADRIVFYNETYATTAVLDMNELSRQIYYFNQSGPIDWGRQSVLPNGEVSLLTNRHSEYSREATFALEGDLVFYGYPVLHQGSCPCLPFRATDPSLTEDIRSAAASRALVCSFNQLRIPLSEKQERIFANLVEMSQFAYRANVQKGEILSIDSLEGGSTFGKQLMEMFEEDDNYRKIHELGFGMNPCRSFFTKENFLPNEMRTGVHFGLGLTPYTEFHLDLVCTTLSVIAESGTKNHTIMGSMGSP